MAKFSDAKCSGAIDPKLQTAHNRLIDLLNTGQVFEMTVNGHAIRIVLNREGLTGTIDGVSMFGLDPVTGKFAIGTYEDLITSLGGLALLDVVETTELGTSIFDGTYINTNLIEKNLYIQDVAPVIAIPSLWLETGAGAPKSLWMVTLDGLASLLVVSGGGGGRQGAAGSYEGGGGNSGIPYYDSAYSLAIGTHDIAVGAGGISNGNGGLSSFDAISVLGGLVGTTSTRGGDGAAMAGVLGVDHAGGSGGNGVAYSISGTATYYSGGGGGSCPGYVDGTGGISGLGSTGTSATYGTVGNDSAINKGGGGGGGSSVGSKAGGVGGSGVVIVRYVTAEFGTCTGGNKTTDGAYTVHTFTENGTLTVVTL